MSSSPPPQSPPIHDNEHNDNDVPLGIPLLLPPPPLALPPPPSSSSRRLPPPCWTPDETAALIDAYREKWYSLRRGNLRANHWQEVADEIHRCCPNVSPPKTAVQCRHKMEKLRKRYRVELQRAHSIPHHRFSSTWIYFSKMDSMEKGNNKNNNDVNNKNLNLVVHNNVNNSNSNYFGIDDMNVNYGNDNGGDEDVDADIFEDYNNYRSEFPKDYYQRNQLKIRIAGNSRKSYGGFEHVSNSSPKPKPNPNANANPNHGFGRFAESPPPPPPSRPQFQDGSRFGMRDSNNCGGSGSGGSLGMGMNVVMKKKRSKLGKRGREEDDDEDEEGKERGKGNGGLVAMEMVEAIREMAEGFMRVEQMKMEMVRESERQRMEYEIKRTQMILESQRWLVEAFAKGWSELVVNNGDNKVHDEDNNGFDKDEP